MFFYSLDGFCNEELIAMYHLSRNCILYLLETIAQTYNEQHTRHMIYNQQSN